MASVTGVENPNEILYKVLVLGEVGVGKTSFVSRYIHNTFAANYKATIGVDFGLKVIENFQGRTVRLQLWDVAGQERFGTMTRNYYKEAVGALLIYDKTRKCTFDNIAKWKMDLDSKATLDDGRPIPMVLLANKCDLPDGDLKISADEIEKYRRENNFVGFFETSAKQNINLDKAVNKLVEQIRANDPTISAHPADAISLVPANSAPSQSGGGCSC